MSKYLFEVGVEELPYKFIPMAIEQLKNGFESFFKDISINLYGVFTKGITIENNLNIKDV